MISGDDLHERVDGGKHGNVDYPIVGERVLNLIVPFRQWTLSVFVVLLVCPVLSAADENFYDLEIDERTLSAALLEFSKQAGIQLVVPDRALKGHNAPPISGSYSAAEVLTRLLESTDLIFEFVGDVTVIIRAPDPAKVSAASKNFRQRSEYAGLGGREAASEGATDRVIENIVVTGSHIARSEFSAAIPITLIDSEDIEIASIETLDGILQQLPSVQQVNGARESQSGTERSGVASVALRGLGVSRTLTLLDGKRMVSGRTGQSNVDLSTIPIDFIERIEVLTGGASAIYGSDALAGVVNIITKKDFEGFNFRTRVEVPEAGGEENYSVSMTLGSNFADDRGNAMVNFSFFDREALFSRDRDFARQVLEVRSDGTLGPDNSNFTVGGLFELWDATGSRVGTSSTGRLVLTDGQVATRPFVEDIHGYNTNELATITTPTTRYNFSTKLNYQLTEAISVNVAGHFAQTDTLSERSPENVEAEEFFRGSDFNAFLIPITHPFIPQSILDIAFNEFPSLDALGNPIPGTTDVIGLDWRRRLTEIPRFIDNTRETFRFSLGFDGDFGGSWDWDVGFNYGRTLQAQHVSGNTIKDNVVDALDIEADPTNPGQFRCVDPQAVLRGCVPLDIFGENSISEAAAAWIHDDSLFRGTIEQWILSAVLSGDLMELPAGSLGFAVGAEYREDDSETITDSVFRDQGTTFVAVPNNSGHTDVAEAFVEFVVPLIANKPFANYFDVDVAVRFADYSHVGSVVSSKAGFEYAPIQSLRFRGGWSRATRAPSIIEAFSVPRTTATFSVNDPCDGVTAATTAGVADNCRSIPSIAAEIAATGVFNENTQFENRGFNKGNPNLIEEQSDTITIGAVFEPEFLPGFGISVDYWDIDIDDAIVGTDHNISTRVCYDSVGLSSQECSLVFRDGTGQINRVDSEERNESGFITSGLDLHANYFWDLGNTFNRLKGTIDFELYWTHLFDKDVLRIIDTNTGEIDIDDDNGEVENPTDRLQVQASYKNGPWRVSWLTNILGKVNTGNQALAEAIEDGEHPDKLAFRTIDTHYISKLNGSYTFGSDGQYQIFAGINNIFDEDPPLIPDNIEDEADRESSCVSNCSQYDPVGRAFFVGFSMSL